MTVRFRRLSTVVLLSALVLIMASQSIVGQVMPPRTSAYPSSPTFSGCGSDWATQIDLSLEHEVVVLVNDIRTAAGLPALKHSTSLNLAARYYSYDMGQDDYFPADHATYDGAGGTMFQCDMGARIKNFYDWSFVAENIMSGCATAQCAVDWWMGSSGHRTNILRDTVCDTGVGYYDLAGSGSPYFTQDFGWQQGEYSVVINGDKLTTNSTKVSVTICVPNISWAEKWNEMCVSNDGAPCTNWIPLLTPFTWHLNGGNGTKTVTVQLRDGAKTTTSSDIIELDETAPSPSKPMDVHLPMILKNAGTAVGPGWQTIVREDFEGAFPGAWKLSDLGTSGGEYLWARTPCEWYAGSWGGWAVGGGADGSSLFCGRDYPHNVKSWMIYGPFSLADASQAEFTTRLWLDLPTDYSDYIFQGASIDGTSFSGYSYADRSGSWGKATMDLKNVPGLGDLTGQPSVWVALVFNSDGSGSNPDGAHADDIVVRKYVPVMAQSSGAELQSGEPVPDQGLATFVGIETQMHR